MLPGPHAAQVFNTETVNTPARSNFIIPNVGSSLTPEGIYVYKAQQNTDGTGANVLWQVAGTPDGLGGITFGQPTQVGNSSTTANTIYNLTEGFKNNSSGIATSYDVAFGTTNPPSTVAYGNAGLALTASASAGTTPTFTLVSGPATLSGSALTITGLGEIVVSVSFPGNAS